MRVISIQAAFLKEI